MEFHSERLVFKKVIAADKEIYFQMVCDEAVMRFITARALTRHEAHVRFEKILEMNRQNLPTGVFSARLKHTSQIIGVGKITPYEKEQAEVGYMLLPAYWGQRYATEILSQMIHHGKQIIGLKGLVAIIDPMNIGSFKMLDRQKFAWYRQGEIGGLAAAYYQLPLTTNHIQLE